MFNLKSLSDHDLIQQTQKLVRQERECTAAILEHIREIEKRKLYAEFNCNSLFAYCVQELKYSEQQAQRRIQAARLLEMVPEVEPLVKKGELNLTHMGKAQSLFNKKEFNQQEKKKFLESLAYKSSQETDKIIKGILPDPEPRQKMRAVNGKRSELRFCLEGEALEKFNQVKELMGEQNLEKIVGKLIDCYLQQKTIPVKSSRENKANEQQQPQQTTRYIPAAVKKEILLRSGGQCEYRSPITGEKCTCKHHLQFAHIKAFAHGGKNTVENLKIFCRTHNLRDAVNVFGRNHMDKYLNPPAGTRTHSVSNGTSSQSQ